MLWVMALVATQVQQGSTIAIPLKPLTYPGSWVSNDDYPPAAQQAGEQGVVAFRLDIDANGLPASCSITDSSGFNDLDQATCTLMLKRARFYPAIDAAGKAIAVPCKGRFNWKLATVESSSIAPAYSRVDLEVSDKDAIMRCAVVGSAPHGSSLCDVYGSGLPTDLVTDAAGKGRHRIITIEVLAGDPGKLPALIYDQPGHSGVRYYRMAFGINEAGALGHCEAHLRVGAKDGPLVPAACSSVDTSVLSAGAKLRPQENVMVHAASWQDFPQEVPTSSTGDR